MTHVCVRNAHIHGKSRREWEVNRQTMGLANILCYKIFER